MGRAQYDSVSGYVDRLLGARVARTAFGDSAEKRRDMDLDLQLRKAIEMLQHAQTQKDLFSQAQQYSAVIPKKD